jgi:hypothetical protein
VEPSVRKITSESTNYTNGTQKMLKNEIKDSESMFRTLFSVLVVSLLPLRYHYQLDL